MCREITRCAYLLPDMGEEIAGFGKDPVTWLAGQARRRGLSYLLAHADDGVIWGWMDGPDLLLSHQPFPKISPELREPTLQQARLFGPDAELMVWRDGEGCWQARLLCDENECDENAPDAPWCFDEAQVLWGDRREGEASLGFTLVSDGQQGLRHAVPPPDGEIIFPEPGYRPLRLGIRHYLEPDEDGMLVIVHSRLTGLRAIQREEGSDA